MKALAVFVAILLNLSWPLAPQSRWEQADLAIRRLAPSAFPELPPGIRSALEARRCTIPQPGEDELAPAARNHSQNVISGRFHQTEALDWAVLCSRERASTILVFWDGEATRVSRFADWPDQQFLQMSGSDRIGYSRLLAPATPARIRMYLERDGVRSPRVNQTGIEDMFLGKASQVWYWDRGRWVHLTGAD